MKRMYSIQFDFLHATPPMSPLDMMKGQPITDANGWVDVHKTTLQHSKYGEAGLETCTW